MGKNRQNNGVTLIVLIITIIVLLILAGVGINLVIGDNGIIAKDRKAAIKTEIEEMKQSIEVERSSYTSKVYEYNTSPTGMMEPIKPNYNTFIPQKYQDFFEASEDGTLIYVGSEDSEIAQIAKESNITIGQSLLKDELMLKIDALWELAQNYKTTNISVEDTDIELVLQYIRRKRYNTSIWQDAAGKVNTGFVEYVKSYSSELDTYNFSNAKVTGSDTDFCHMIAALNSLVHEGSFARMPIGGKIDLPDEYSGWAGDLVTLMAEVIEYDENGLTLENKLVEYAKSKLAIIGVSSNHDYPDMIANMDAVNIYAIYQNETEKNFAKIMFNYYYKNKVDFENKKILFVRNISPNGETALKQLVRDNFVNNSVVVYGILCKTFKNGSDLALKYNNDIGLKYTNAVAQAFHDYFNNL